jgi:TldD protein
MDKFLSLAEKKGASYAEIMNYSSKKNAIEVADKNIKEMSSGDVKLYSARVLYKNRVGMAYSYLDDYNDLLDKAIKSARANDNEADFSSMNAINKKVKTEYKINPLNISLEEKKDDLMKLDIRNQFKKIVSVKLIYADTVSKWEFLNSDGSNIIWDDCTTGFIAWPFSKEGNDMQNSLKIIRIKGGYELMDGALAAVKEAMKMAEDLLSAKAAKGGLFPTMIDNKLGGVFAHEAIGHACEADHIQTKASILIGKEGKMIGNDVVSIADDGSLNKWGWTPFDSEGVKSSKTQLVKKGVLVGWLHSKETAAQFDQDVTGNGRAQSLGFRVIPRMTNTFIEKGDSSYDEILSEIKKGYYLKGSLGGQVDPAGGEFLFNAQEGYYVENGEIKYMVKGVSLTGSILETLHNIKLVANDMDFGHGYCGKAGQNVPVSEGSPHILIENARVGGSQ